MTGFVSRLRMSTLSRAILAGVGITAAAAALAACAGSESELASDGAGAGVLFVLDVPSSEILESDDTYRLVVPSGENLMWFTEAPERRAGVVSFDHWLATWDAMGFDESPPNAALIVDLGDGPRVHIIEMSDPLVEGHQVSFALTDIGSDADGDAVHAGRAHTHELQAGLMGHTELFIDSVSCDTACTTPSTSALSGADAAELIAKIPAGSVTETSIELGPNVTINTMTVAKQGDGTFTASGTVTLGGTIAVSAEASFTDGANWTFDIGSAGSPPITLGSTGITLDPSTISGSISATDGQITWNVSGSTFTWPIASGATLTTQFSLGDRCPVADEACPGGDHLYVGLPSGSLAISGLPTVELTGGLTIDGTWARLEGTADASASFTVAGARLSMGEPTLTVWRGTRNDSFDPNMVLPDTSALTDGTNLEFCGTFGIRVPGLVNQATDGCARWTPAGIVIGQVGLGPGMTLSGGSVPSGTTADIKGIGWTTLSAADIGKLTLPGANMPSGSVSGASMPGAIGFSGVPTPLLPSGLSLGGKAKLPGIVTSAIGLGATSIGVDVTGNISADAISLKGLVPVKINLDKEPIKVGIDSLTLGFSAGGGKGFSMNLGTSSDLTLGYGSTARVVRSSITLTAATSPAVGFTLSLNSLGNPAAGDTMDGLTPATRLSSPSTATYLVPDLFGIDGVNLWSLTGQIGWQGTSPSVALATTTYLDPTGDATKSVMACTGDCDDDDWMIGNLILDASLSNPCFVYSFDGNSGGGSIAIDGGVMKATRFQVGVSPAGCSIKVGDTTITLPALFAGFAFDASFGNATVSVATQVSESGFIFETTIENIVLGGFNLRSMSLDVSITAESSEVEFDALTTAKNFGTLAFHADMSADSTGLNWDVTADVCTDQSKKVCDPSALAGGLGTQTSGPSAPEQARDSNGNTPVTSDDRQAVGFQLLQMHFEQSGSISSCSSLTGAASGYIVMSKQQYKLLGPDDKAVLPDGTPFPGSQFVIDCNGIQDVDFGITFTHNSSYLRSKSSATKTLLLSWDKATTTLQGRYSVAMRREVEIKKNSYKYSDHINFDIDVDVVISSNYASFEFYAKIHTGRVDGYFDAYMNSSGDFVGKAKLDVDVPWSKRNYDADWNGL